MKKFNLSEIASKLNEDRREFDIGDTISSYYKDELLPIKINGVIHQELKVVKTTFCIYDGYIEDYSVYDYKQDFEILVLEEYSDSPLSVYINASDGEIDTYEYDNIYTIEFGNILTLKVEDGYVTYYQIKEV